MVAPDLVQGARNGGEIGGGRHAILRPRVGRQAGQYLGGAASRFLLRERGQFVERVAARIVGLAARPLVPVGRDVRAKEAEAALDQTAGGRSAAKNFGAAPKGGNNRLRGQG